MLRSGFITFIFLYVWLNHAVTGMAYSPDTNTGYLYIKGRHITAFTVDDSLFRTPVTMPVVVDTGLHNICVFNPRRGTWQYNDWTTSVYIEPGDTVSVSPEFTRPLTIQSDPFDARVFLNDSLLGTTPLYINLPPSASGNLIIEKQLYLPIQIALDSLNSGILKVELPRDNDAYLLFQKTFNKQRQTFNRRKITTYSLMALTLCTGVTTAYLKEKAEKKYEQYLHSSDIETMNRYFAETRRMDKYAGISLGIFEVSFTLSFYYLFKTVVR